MTDRLAGRRAELECTKPWRSCRARLQCRFMSGLPSPLGTRPQTSGRTGTPSLLAAPASDLSSVARGKLRASANSR